MAACETCWSEANRQALMLGGTTVDRYLDLIKQHPDGHADDVTSPSGGGEGR